MSAVEFEIRDANPDGEGWTGVVALTFEDARYAAETIAREGYDLPLAIVPTDRTEPIARLVSFDERGAGIWQTSDVCRSYRNRVRRAA